MIIMTLFDLALSEDVTILLFNTNYYIQLLSLICTQSMAPSIAT